jgi:membrane peptidoglycan carboxypeptidase
MKKGEVPIVNNYNWRKYQQNLKKSRKIKFFFRRIVFMSGVGSLCFVLCIVAFFIFEAGYLFFGGTSGAPEASIERIKLTSEIKTTDVLPKKNYKDCLSDISVNEFLTKEQVNINWGGNAFLVATSIYPDFQSEITKLLAQSFVSYAAAVVIDAFDGKVYALSEYKGEHDSENHLGLKADFPAASLFKIITAAAALEVTGLGHDSELYYDGGQYTLYKKQLKQGKNKWSDKIIFGHAFAQSVNPMKGKIGIYEVGPNTLFNFACAFLFNKKIGSFNGQTPDFFISKTFFISFIRQP